jgi:hypothetical protein
MATLPMETVSSPPGDRRQATANLKSDQLALSAYCKDGVRDIDEYVDTDANRYQR